MEEEGSRRPPAAGVAERWPRGGLRENRSTPSEKLGKENVLVRRVRGSAALNAAESEAQVRTEAFHVASAPPGGHWWLERAVSVERQGRQVGRR